MKKRVSHLSETRNFGKKSEAWLNSIGVYSIDDLRRMGSIRAYFLLRQHGFNVSMNMMYAMEGALLGIHWKILPGEV